MSIFENTLKPEEEIGGFIPGQDGDDIFHLEKLDSYAGDLPDFEFKDPAVSDLIKPKKDESVQNDEEVAEEEIEEGESLPDEGDSFMNSPAAETKKQEATGWGQDYYESEEEEEIAPPVVAAAPAGLVIEDDELKALLASELDRTSERRKMREYTKTLEEENASKPSSGGGYDSPFGDVPEFMEHPEVLDFEEIKADKPSQYGLKDLEGQSHSHEEEAKQEENNTEETKEDKKKKKKRMPLWQIITFSSVAALLLLAGIGWGVYKFMNSELTPEQKKQKEIAEKKEKDKKAGSKIAAVKPAEPEYAEPAHTDAEHTEGETHTDAEHPTDEHTASAEHSAAGEHDAPDHSTVKDKHGSTPTSGHSTSASKHSDAGSGHSSAKETSKNSHDVAIGKPSKKDNKHNEPDHITPKTRKETTTHSTSRKSHSNDDHSESVAHSSSKKSPSKSIKSYSDPSKPIIARKIDIDENVKPLYSVQIYASPSKEDAEDWMMKLKRLKVSSIRMDTQKVRGELWHRVRFGEFDSKEDARNAAIKLGFAQSWIDRIK